MKKKLCLLTVFFSLLLSCLIISCDLTTVKKGQGEQLIVSNLFDLEGAKAFAVLEENKKGNSRDASDAVKLAKILEDGRVQALLNNEEVELPAFYGFVESPVTDDLFVVFNDNVIISGANMGQILRLEANGDCEGVLSGLLGNDKYHRFFEPNCNPDSDINSLFEFDNKGNIYFFGSNIEYYQVLVKYDIEARQCTLLETPLSQISLDSFLVSQYADMVLIRGRLDNSAFIYLYDLNNLDSYKSVIYYNSNFNVLNHGEYIPEYFEFIDEDTLMIYGCFGSLYSGVFMVDINADWSLDIYPFLKEFGKGTNDYSNSKLRKKQLLYNLSNLQIFMGKDDGSTGWVDVWIEDGDFTVGSSIDKFSQFITDAEELSSVAVSTMSVHEFVITGNGCFRLQLDSSYDGTYVYLPKKFSKKLSEMINPDLQNLYVVDPELQYRDLQNYYYSLLKKEKSFDFSYNGESGISAYDKLKEDYLITFEKSLEDFLIDAFDLSADDFFIYDEDNILNDQFHGKFLRPSDGSLWFVSTDCNQNFIYQLINSSGEKDVKAILTSNLPSYTRNYIINEEAVYAKTALFADTGMETGGQKLWKLDLNNQGQGFYDILTEFPENGCVEIVDFWADSSAVYFTALKGMSGITGGHINLETKEYTPFENLEYRIKNIQVYKH